MFPDVEGVSGNALGVLSASPPIRKRLCFQDLAHDVANNESVDGQFQICGPCHLDTLNGRLVLNDDLRITIQVIVDSRL